jgi:predicted HTH domain antitoxin
MAAREATLSVRVELPRSAAGGAAIDEGAVSEELRLLWIVEQVRLHRVGVAKAAELAEMPRAAFMRVLGTHGVAVIDYPADELAGELSRAGET